MKRTGQNGGNASLAKEGTEAALDRRLLLLALQSVRSGDFSVRLPHDWSGIDGKIADTFNEIVQANQKIDHELKRVGQVVGKEGQDPRADPVRLLEGCLGGDGRVGQHADRRPAPAHYRGHRRHRRRRPGQSDSDDATRRRRSAARRRVPPIRLHREHDDPAARRVHLGSDSRGARGGLGRQAGWAGAGPRRERRLERPDRERQLDGEQPDRSGPQHLRGHDRRR